MESRINIQKSEYLALLLYKQTGFCSLDELEEFCLSCELFKVTPAEVLNFCNFEGGFLRLHNDRFVRVTERFSSPIHRAFLREFRTHGGRQPAIQSSKPSLLTGPISARVVNFQEDVKKKSSLDTEVEPQPLLREITTLSSVGPTFPPNVEALEIEVLSTLVANVEAPYFEFPYSTLPDVEISNAQVPDVDARNVIEAPTIGAYKVETPATEAQNVKAAEVEIPVTEAQNVKVAEVAALALEDPNGVQCKQKLKGSKVVPSFEDFGIEAEVGSGGYGTVYKVQQHKDGRVFAIKCPLEKTHSSCVQNEINMLKRLRGKDFIVQIEGEVKGKLRPNSDAGVGDIDCPSIVLEYFEHDKPEVLKKEITINELKSYCSCLFKALAQLHRERILHLDVKPGNFLFSRSKKRGCLVDFNLARDELSRPSKRQKSIQGVVDQERNFSQGQKVPKRQLVAEDGAHKAVIPTKRSRKMVEKLNGVDNPWAQKLKTLPGKKMGTSAGKSGEIRGAGRKATFRSPDIAQQPTEPKASVKVQEITGDAGTAAERMVLEAKPHSKERPHASKSQARQAKAVNIVDNILIKKTHPGIRRFIQENNIKQVLSNPVVVQKKKVPLGKMKVKFAGFDVPVAHPQIVPPSKPQNVKAAPKLKRPAVLVKDGPCVGTKGYRAPEVLMRSLMQTTKVDIWSAGVSLLQLVTGRSPFPSTSTDGALKDIARLRGSENVSKLAKSLGRHHRISKETIPPVPVKEWCERQSKRPELKGIVPSDLYDLIERCLEVDPESRITAQQAAEHKFCLI